MKFSEKYTFQNKIAQGGMGVLYQAIHASLNRQVAIKVLHPQFSKDPSFLQRFMREARAMARLDHEHIIRIFDVGQEQGTHYIAMEFFPGKDLRKLIQEHGKFPNQKVIDLAKQVAVALVYAHEHGIIHRDIKPANILMDSQGLVKLTDFGIATAADETSVTSTGQIIGTPEYMSPEQARGEELDGRSDLYSLGMVMYEMLTGRTPYHEISPLAMIGKLAYEKEELSLNFPQETSTTLEALIQDLLRKQPSHRILNALSLVDRLNELDNPGSVTSDSYAPETLATIQAQAATSMSKTPSKGTHRPWRWAIGGAILFLFVFAAYSFMRSSYEPIQYLLNKKTSHQDSSETLARFENIQAEMGQMQNAVLHSRLNANTVNAQKWMPVVYQEAEAMEAKGIEASQTGDHLYKQNEYQQAKFTLNKAMTMLDSAKDLFENAHKGSLDKQENRNNRLDQTTRADQISRKHRENEVFSRILSRFEDAFENKDLARLQRTTKMSEKKTRFLQDLFEDYAQVKISISNLSLTNNNATAVVSINQLTDHNGNFIDPPESWHEIEIKIERIGNRWGKVIW